MGAIATKGKFIVIEGTDGSGKTEQMKRLLARIPKEIRTETIHFPQHGEPSSYFVDEYLNGKYGTAETVGPYRASLFYGLDRFDAALKKMNQWLADGRIVIADRYVGSNMGHQGGKIKTKEERKNSSGGYTKSNTGFSASRNPT
ncbi:MAG: hypothetical protein KGJ13_03705 [Patescibacteria group bacterium]|nr:hypothetical protein [Patescibacteria group bacterium]